MRPAAVLILAAACCLHGQTFEVASVKASARTVGPDYNNQITTTPTAFTGRNVTLKRLVGFAYSFVPFQVSGGPKWIDETEFDIEAKSSGPASREQMRAMMRTLLADRFQLATRRDTKETRVWEMVVDKGGPKIHAVEDGQGTPAPLGSSHFHGELQQLANLIAVQLTVVMVDDPTRPGVASGAPVPVLDKTGLTGTFDFDIQMKPETDPLATWQAILQQQLGLRLEGRRAKIESLIVDRAERPSAN